MLVQRDALLQRTRLMGPAFVAAVAYVDPGNVATNTAAGAAFGKPEYIHTGCGMGREATLYLTERGVRVVGTDAWSWDAPFSHTARKWAQTRDPKIIWEGHKAGREIPYWQMEKLFGLAALPPFGFEVSCFPV